jgi:hypothetical protein
VAWRSTANAAGVAFFANFTWTSLTLGLAPFGLQGD